MLRGGVPGLQIGGVAAGSRFVNLRRGPGPVPLSRSGAAGVGPRAAKMPVKSLSDAFRIDDAIWNPF